MRSSILEGEKISHTNFREYIFPANADFGEAQFSGTADFINTVCKTLILDDAKFYKQIPDFRYINLTMVSRACC